MAKNDVLPAETVRKLLSYNPETGELRWKPRGAEFFTDGKFTAETQAARWNTRHAGNVAFAISVKGHRVGNLLGRRVYSHRVIWIWMTGKWPEGDVDHINGDKADNRWVNLRDVPHYINGRNMPISRANTSGVTGVYWHRKRQKWCASIKVNGEDRYLGLFTSLTDAAAARAQAQAEHGFTERHGT